MAILSQGNYLGGQRIEVHNFRSIESSVAGDFDVLAGRAIGSSLPLIVKGFYISTSSGTIGAAANTLQVVVAGGVAINVNASEAGSIFWLPDDESPVTLNAASGLVEGGFTSGSTNYVGLDLYREADAETTDLAKFIDANTNNEISQEIPLRRTLKYRLIVTTTPFSADSTVNPIAVVVTDASNKVSSIKDARNLAFRLGRGGDIPNALYKYSFPSGRTESTAAASAFVGGDKAIGGLKESIDAIYTRLWELGGGERWYSPTADRNVRMVRDPLDTFSNGDNFETSSNNLHWRGLSVLFDNASNSGVYINEIADQLSNSSGLTNLAVGECLYVDLDRTQNRTGVNALTVQKSTLQALGTPEIPGSRYIIAWRTSNGSSFDIVTRDFPYLVDSGFAAATTTSNGAVRLAYTAGTPTTPIVLPLASNNGISIGGGSYTVTTGTALSITTNSSSTALNIVQTGSGNAITTDNTIQSGGDFIITNNTDKITWQTARTFTFYVPLSTLHNEQSAGIAFNFVGSSTGEGIVGHWENGSTGSGALMGGSIHIPKGATLTEFKLNLRNQEAVSKTFSVNLLKVEESGSGVVWTSMLNGPQNIVVSAGDLNWFTSSIGSGGDLTFSDDGYIAAYVGFPTSTAAGQLHLRGIKITYTMNNIYPAL